MDKEVEATQATFAKLRNDLFCVVSAQQQQQLRVTCQALKRSTHEAAQTWRRTCSDLHSLCRELGILLDAQCRPEELNGADRVQKGVDSGHGDPEHRELTNACASADKMLRDSLRLHAEAVDLFSLLDGGGSLDWMDVGDGHGDTNDIVERVGRAVDEARAFQRESIDILSNEAAPQLRRRKSASMLFAVGVASFGLGTMVLLTYPLLALQLFVTDRFSAKVFWDMLNEKEESITTENKALIYSLLAIIFIPLTVLYWKRRNDYRWMFRWRERLRLCCMIVWPALLALILAAQALKLFHYLFV